MKLSLFALLAVMLVPLSLFAEDQEKKMADPDLAVQGEYLGKIKTDDGDRELGIQVIAQGKGTFKAIAYYGGLPGAGWNGEETVEAEGKTEDNGQTVFNSDYGKAIIKGEQMEIYSTDGSLIATFEKTHRKSSTLGAKPPEGAVVLFDGTTAENFQGGRLEGDLLREGVTSKQKFQDCTLHLEFRLSFMPEARGQGRANSGCYLQGRYEVQILDSFGLKGENNECGGIYSMKAPNVNMCYPPMEWQTYDIDFKAAKYDESGKKTANATMTVKHNGVVIHKDIEVPKSTTAAPVAEGPEPGPLYLQNHGNPIWFRNIWILEK